MEDIKEVKKSLNNKTRQIYERRRGFSLLELMLAITLFATMVALLMNSMFQGDQNTKRLAEILDLRQEIRVLRNLITKDLQTSIYLEQFSKAGVNTEASKSGIIGEDEPISEDVEIDRIHMHVHRRALNHRGVENDPLLHEVSYYMRELEEEAVAKRREESGKEDDGTGEEIIEYELVRREEFYLDDDITEGDRSIELSLSQNVNFFDIKYLAAGGGLTSLIESEDEGWEDSWDSSESKKLPYAVQVIIGLETPLGEKIRETFQVNLDPLMGVDMTGASSTTDPSGDPK